MAFVNEEKKEICAKILYLGARGAGKTSNLRSLLSSTSEELQKGTHHLTVDQDNTCYFDFLPLSLGKIHNFEIKVHLFAFELDHPFSSFRKIIMGGVDGFVFIVDSTMERLIANRECLKLARFYFREEGYLLSELLHVIQFNKRDEKNLISSEALSKEFNLFDAPEIEAVATHSQGTMETLNLITRQIVDRVVPGYSLSIPPLESTENTEARL
jgi:signal recognition particle receptor subunit beta